MNRKLLIELLLLISGAACAENVKVLAVSQGTVKVGTMVLKKGVVFDSKSSIIWDSKQTQQVMKVVGLDSHRIYLLSSKVMSLSGKTSLEQLFVGKKALATRRGVLLNLEEMRRHFNRRLALLNALHFETPFTLDEHHFFFLQYEKDGELVNKRLPFKGQTVTIDDSIFVLDGGAQQPETRSYKLFYYEETAGKLTLIANQLVLSVDARCACASLLESSSSCNLTTTEWAEIVKDFCIAQYPSEVFDDADIEAYCSKWH